MLDGLADGMPGEGRRALVSQMLAGIKPEN